MTTKKINLKEFKEIILNIVKEEIEEKEIKKYSIQDIVNIMNNSIFNIKTLKPMTVLTYDDLNEKIKEGYIVQGMSGILPELGTYYTFNVLDGNYEDANVLYTIIMFKNKQMFRIIN